MTTLATLIVKIVGDISEYSATIEESQKMTDSFAGNAVTGLSAIGGGVVLGALSAAATAGTAVGVAMWNSAETIDKAYDAIATKTGATGEVLEGLQGTFNNVFKRVPTDAGTAAEAVAALNTRLGLTGPALEATSVTLLNMTKLLGGDVNTNAELFTRVIGDWSVPLENSGSLMDKLFTASQKTGVGVESLMGNVVQFGAPLRNMGFDLDTSIALFAKWEKEGVNAELVMGSLRIAAGKFAAENIPLKQGLEDTMSAIKGAKDNSEALSIAMGVFGARAAGDMAVAIREGRFDIDDLVASLQNADGAIRTTVASTEDWSEKWARFTNFLTVSLAPMGETLRGITDDAIAMLEAFLSKAEVQDFIADMANKVAAFGDTVEEWMPILIEKLQDFSSWLGENKGVIVAGLAMIGVAILVFAYTSLMAAIPIIGAFVVTWGPVILVLGLVGLAAFLLYQAWETNFGGIQQKTAEVAAFLKGVFADLTVVFEVWKANTVLLFQAFWAIIHGDWKTGGEKLGQMMGNTFDLLDAITSGRLKSLGDIWHFGLDDILFMILDVPDWSGAGAKVMELIKQGFMFGLDDLIKAIFDKLAGVGQATSDFLNGLLTGQASANNMQSFIASAQTAGSNSSAPRGANGGNGANIAAGLMPAGAQARPLGNAGFEQLVVNYYDNAIVSSNNENDVAEKIGPAVVAKLRQYGII